MRLALVALVLSLSCNDSGPELDRALPIPPGCDAPDAAPCADGGADAGALEVGAGVE